MGAVTAEVASSSLVVPAISFEELSSISAKHLRVQKDTFSCPVCTRLSALQRVPFPLLSFLTSQSVWVPRAAANGSTTVTARILI
jgi:hypothetical protein